MKNYLKEENKNMNKKIKKRIHKKFKLNLFHTFMFLSACLGAFVLIHDFIVWAIIPLFTGDFIMLTYFGMFVDLTAILLIDMTIQCFKES